MRAALTAAALVAIAGVAYAWQTVGAVGPGLPLRLVGDYPLTGNATRFDYASIDAARKAIWVAHMGDGSDGLPGVRDACDCNERRSEERRAFHVNVRRSSSMGTSSAAVIAARITIARRTRSSLRGKSRGVCE